MRNLTRWRLGAFCTLATGALVTCALATCVGPQAIPRPGETCPFDLATLADVPVVHFPPGTAINWTSNPPATGPHFVIWARWNRSYHDPALERGYWVHNLEHGGVALLYNCPDGCPDEVAAMEKMMADYPTDPACTPPVKNRILVTSDPLLPEGVRFAAAAWDHTYTAGCFDAASLNSFIQAHHGKGPPIENVCVEGGFPSPTDAGIADLDSADAEIDAN